MKQTLHSTVFICAIWASCLFIPNNYAAAQTDAGKKQNPENYGDKDSVPVINVSLTDNNPDSVSKFTFSVYPVILGAAYPFSEGNSVLYACGAAADISASPQVDLHFFGSIGGTYINTDYQSSRNGWCNDAGVSAAFFKWNSYITKDQHVAYVWHPDSINGLSMNLHADTREKVKSGFRLGAQYYCGRVSGSHTDLMAYDINDPAHTKIDLATDDKWHWRIITPYKIPALYATNMNALFLTAGFETDFTRSFGVNLKNIGHGLKEIRKRNTFFADLVYAPYVQYEDILANYPETSKHTLLNVDAYTAKERLGFKAGWSYRSLKTFGGSRAVEIGYLPNTGLYGLVKIGFAINPFKY